MNNKLENDYKASEAIHEAYNTAEKNDDINGIEKARADYDTWRAGIMANGRAYTKIYNYYEDARTVGNKYIDIHDTINDDEIKDLVAEMRALGIDHFTFSSGWTSAVNTAWLFQQEGCSVEGIAEINTRYKAFMSNEWEKGHGYIFRVN